MRCEPAETEPEFQLAEYGAAASYATSLPSMYHLTAATPTLSVAVAARLTVPATVDPATGAVTLTKGAVMSAALAVAGRAAPAQAIAAAIGMVLNRRVPRAGSRLLRVVVSKA